MLTPKVPGVPTLSTVKVKPVPELVHVTLVTEGIVPEPVNATFHGDTVAQPQRPVPTTVTVDAAPPAVPALPVIVVICGPSLTPRPTVSVTVPLLSVNVTG